MILETIILETIALWNGFCKRDEADERPRILVKIGNCPVFWKLC